MNEGTDDEDHDDDAVAADVDDDRDDQQKGEDCGVSLSLLSSLTQVSFPLSVRV